jgi:NAD(P)H-flavin reductase
MTPASRSADPDGAGMLAAPTTEAPAAARKSLPWWRLRTWRKDFEALVLLRNGLQALDADDDESEVSARSAGSRPDADAASADLVRAKSPSGEAPADEHEAAAGAAAAASEPAASAGAGAVAGDSSGPTEPDPAMVAIRATFDCVAAAADEAAAYFYARLFLQEPTLRELFPPAMDEQRDRLFRALARVVESLSSPEELATYLSQLGRDHRKYGVEPRMYEAVGGALIATLRAYAADKFTPAAEQAWLQTYEAGSSLMIRAAEEDAASSPAFWTAEVVHIDRRSDGIAVLTIAPDADLPYLAGQHITVQTSRWPRVWRQYSIACKPRDDGLIVLHVRAIPGGWVSNALVSHTKPGDELTLGPALGTMTLAPAGTRDLLCIAGGTGLSPIKAIIEQAVRESVATPRRISLFYGARRRAELYDLRDLWRLCDAYDRLSLTPVTSDDPAFDGMQGNVGRVAARYLPEECEAYVAGPAEMVRDTIRALKRAGVPAPRIHYDDALLAARARVGSGT